METHVEQHVANNTRHRPGEELRIIQMPNLSHQLFQIENEHGQTNTNLIGLHVHDMTQMSIGYSISMTNGDTHCPI